MRCPNPAARGTLLRSIASVYVLVSQVVLMSVSGTITAQSSDTVFSPQAITEVMRRACDYQLKLQAADAMTSKSDINYEWIRGAFMTCVMPLYEATSDTRYLDAVLKWGEDHAWKPVPPDTRHADFQCCGQAYLELYLKKKNPAMLAGIRANIDAQMSSPTLGREEWWWCDALYMAPPVLTRLYAATGERKYLDFLNTMYWDTHAFLYDPTEHLFFRDKNFFDAKTKNGKKAFWSRGNGWVLGGLARLLQYLPKDDPGYPKFIQLFKEMSAKIASIQPADGLWRPALLDPEDFTTSETSGSSFFTYALAWGINNKLLDREDYEPVVRKAWAGLVQAVTPEGRLGYVQTVAAAPGAVNPADTREYAVGAFLLAGTEILKMVPTEEPGTSGTGHLTSAARAAGWTEKNVGATITNVNVLSGCFGTDADGSAVIYATLTGNPAQLAVVDAHTAQVKRVLPIPDAEGGYATIQAKSGVVYIGTYSNGNLYSYTPGANAVENVGRAAPKVTFLWDLEEGPGGKIYCACYNESRLVEYNPASRKFHDWGPLVPGEDYARGIAYDAKRNRIFAGIGSHAHMLEFDPDTGAKTEILPEEWKAEHFVYNVQLEGGRLFIKLDPTNRGTVYNPETKQVEAYLGEFGGSMYSSPDANGNVYFTSQGNLMRYNIASRTKEFAGLKVNAGARAFTWQAAEAGKTPRLLGLMMGGKLMEFDPATSIGTVKKIELPQQAVQLQNLTAGPDGNIYTSGYLTGGVGKYDPRTDKSVQFAGIGQGEGIAAIGNDLYFGTYPRAIFYQFDITKPWNKEKGNPRELFSLHSSDQDRSFGMLARPDDRKLYIGTVPGYGILGGALTEYDAVTSSIDVHRDVVAKQSVVSLTWAEGLVLGGTSIYGGLGIVPQTKDGQLFGWDPKKKEKVFEMVPAAGARAVTSLRVGKDGLVYGWAEGTVFAFDLKTRKVVRSSEKFPPGPLDKHIWRGTWWEDAPDEHLYTVTHGALYHLNRETLALDPLTSGPEIEQLARTPDGALYSASKENLIRFAK